MLHLRRPGPALVIPLADAAGKTFRCDDAEFTVRSVDDSPTATSVAMRPSKPERRQGRSARQPRPWARHHAVACAGLSPARTDRRRGNCAGRFQPAVAAAAEEAPRRPRPTGGPSPPSGKVTRRTSATSACSASVPKRPSTSETCLALMAAFGSHHGPPRGVPVESVGVPPVLAPVSYAANATASYARYHPNRTFERRCGEGFALSALR